MADPNAGQVELSCPGCQTTFHLRPRKSRMPRNPIPCPKCGTSIEMTEGQMNRLRSLVGATTPNAQVLKRRASSSGERPGGPSDEDLDEMERLAKALGGERNNSPSGTLMGHPVAIGEQNFDRNSSDHKTRESTESERTASGLDERPATSEISKEEVERARAAMKDHGANIHFSSFGSEADEDEGEEIDTAEKERDDAEDAEGSESVHNATTLRPPGMPPAPAPLSEVSDDSKPAGKVPLSELLKKVRSKHSVAGLPLPKPASASAAGDIDSSANEQFAPSTDDVFEDLVDDVVGSTTEKLSPVRETADSADIGAPSSTGRSENSMLARLKKIPRSGLREKPGMAGERRGSGYIRLPESEILDMLGEGDYRLRVEDIVYEPIGDGAIEKLIKMGKLKGSDEIAESDGNWIRLKEHELFRTHSKPPLPTAPTAPPLPKPPVKGDTKPMFPAAPKSAAPKSAAPESAAPKSGPPKPATPEPAALEAPDVEEAEVAPPPPIEKRTSSTSGEWLQTDLDSTFDSLDSVDESGPHTPPPHVVSDSSVDDIETDDALAEPLDEAPADVEPEDDSGPDFPEDDDFKIDGPASYPAIELPEPEPEPEPEPHVAEAATALDPKPHRRSSFLPILAGVLVLGSIAAGGAYLVSSGGFDGVGADPALATKPGAEPTDTTAAATTPTEPDTEEPPAEPTPAERRAAAIASGNWGEALPLIEEAYRDSPGPELAIQRIQALVETGNFRRARLAVFAARSLGGNEKASLDEWYQKSIVAQQEAGRDIVAVDQGWTDFERVSASPLLYRIVDPDGAAWRFIPNQDGEVTWRAEVAFYELCGLIACGFEVPKTVEASVSAEALTALAGGSVPVDKLEQRDGIVRGALRRAVEEEHVGWPIEDTGIWRSWLDADSPVDELDNPLAKGLDDLGADQRDKLVAASADASARALAMQTANILATDYLVNNFARFASRRENYGSTVRLVDGQLVSVSNRAAFQPRTSTRVRGRFSWTTRFGKDFVDTVRTLDREQVDPLLFPDASGAEKARLGVFWDQRERLVERVDELIESQSEEAVLPF